MSGDTRNPFDFGTGRRGRSPFGNSFRPERWVLVIVLVLVGIVGLVIVATGQGGFVDVKDTEASVIVNHVTGSRDVVTTPGFKIFLPVLQQAFVFDKSPQEFVMQGDRDVDANHVSKLTVRANDGSNFWFDEIKIQYELIAGSADMVLGDSGSGEAFKQHWVRAYARSILRDEFGRLSAENAADPTQFKKATTDAERRLNDALDPHGVHVMQIITPRPKFEARYEKAIEDRKVANQEVQKLMARWDQLQREKERRLAEIESLRSIDFEALKGDLEAERIDTEKDRVRRERTADAYKKQKVGEGEAMRAARAEEARGLEEKARKEAEGLTAITEALEVGGEVLVREQLAQMLRQVRFTLIPYSKDPSPTRIELLDDTANEENHP